MEITIHLPEADKLAQAVTLLAAALGDKSAAALMREQKWNANAELQHPDEDPKPVQPITTTAEALQTVQQTAPVQQAPTYQAVPTAAPQQPVTQPQTAPVQSVPTTVPTTAKTYTLPELAKAAGQLMDSGKQQQLIDLLNKTFGVQALNFLPVERYGDFATALRGLGAQL
ncbi:hypothetical protein ACFP7A_00930 [Sporolactobacillus kofuensis]|uniref:Uncharacterized protein n=1 Tax=Sporolactobacillus kofuensis TaxID=269672 RepID=A0ABW1WBT7_9BACL|nr:hypothetical protein [Sporolactobacillus kofuensis]MCO7175533.1 hypothetical protein [Sporolactobacillus kofuensis]